MDNGEEALPAFGRKEAFNELIAREEDKDRLAHDVILRHEAPVAAVPGIVAVVAHHPIVVHLEGVARSRFAVHIVGAVA